MSTFLGVDFGTTACRTAVLRRGSLEVVSNRFCNRYLQPIVEPTSRKENSSSHILPFITRSLKQEIGTLLTVASADRVRDVLSQVRDDVLDAIGEAVSGTVLGVPSACSERSRAALRDAAHGAGFDTIRFIDEASAVILGAVRPIDHGTLLVYALGAGVFSATVLRLANGKPDVLAAEGQSYLGEHDLDAAMASLILRRLGRGTEFVDPQASLPRLRDLAERVKEGLSRREEEIFDINLTELYGAGGVISLAVRRAEFEEEISGTIESTLIMARKAIAGAGLATHEINFIVMAGDSTRIPLVERRIASEYSVQRIRTGSLDVARGAAILGGQTEDANWKRKSPTIFVPPAVAPASTPDPRPTPAPIPLRRIAPNAPESGTWLGMFASRLLEAETQWKAGQQRVAINTFEKMLGTANEYLGTLYHTLGQGLFRDGLYDDAVNVLKKAVTLSQGDEQALKNYHEALNHRAIGLADTGRWQEARLVIREALAVNPQCQACSILAERIRQALKTTPHSPSGGFKGKKRR